MFSKILSLVLIMLSNILFVQSKNDVKRQILKRESIIHLKFFGNYLSLFDKTENDIRFKVSFNSKNQEKSDKNIEIFVLNAKNNHFIRQEKYGHLYNPKEFVLISLNVTGQIEKQPFIIEFFQNKEQNSVCNVIALSYLLPFDKTVTDGLITTNVINQNKELIGSININYLIIRPINGFNADSDHALNFGHNISGHSPNWIGHRGTGEGRRTDLKGNILENTIQAFNYVCRNKADMVELDVQISKDKIPVIYHDFNAKVFLKEKSGKYLSVEIPVSDLTYKQLNKISIEENNDFDYEDNQPFETLASVLQKIEPNCGIDFEIKYPQQFSDKTWEGVKGLDLNEYIDIIIKTIYENIGDRTAIITSFHADLCAMFNLKQNMISVALLTSGNVANWKPQPWKPYLDPRATAIPLSTYFAEGMNFKGLVIHPKDLLSDIDSIKFVKMHNLFVYIWGQPLKDKEVISALLDMGADGFICDEIDIVLKNWWLRTTKSKNRGKITPKKFRKFLNPQELHVKEMVVE